VDYSVSLLPVVCHWLIVPLPITFSVFSYRPTVECRQRIFEFRIFSFFLQYNMDYLFPGLNPVMANNVHSLVLELHEVASFSMMTSSVGARVTSAEVPRPPAVATVDDSAAGDMEPMSASNGFNAYIFIHTDTTDQCNAKLILTDDRSFFGWKDIEQNRVEYSQFHGSSLIFHKVV